MFSRKTPNSEFQMVGHHADQEKFQPAQASSWRQRWSWRRRIIVGVAVLLALIALAVGLGVGLTLGGPGNEGSENDENASPPVSRNNATPGGIWTPAAGTTWNYELLNVVDDTSSDAEVWDIDLFSNDEKVISSLQSAGKKVLCYFSAGSYEDWRLDKDQFQDSDMGNDLSGWAGEKWLDTNSDNVRKIMQTRLDLAAEKNCNGVEPDNVDAYDNDSGLNLGEADAADYVTFLANEAHSRKLSMALKNAGNIVSTVVDLVEYAVQEQCIQYQNCDQFMPFIEANKPVFHVEYPKGDSTDDNNLVATSTKDRICDNNDAANFSTIIKNMNLDAWIEPCPSNKSNIEN